jgi:hypothetical protein
VVERGRSSSESIEPACGIASEINGMDLIPLTSRHAILVVERESS